jgi:hypothetical protein
MTQHPVPGLHSGLDHFRRNWTRSLGVARLYMPDVNRSPRLPRGLPLAVNVRTAGFATPMRTSCPTSANTRWKDIAHLIARAGPSTTAKVVPAASLGVAEAMMTSAGECVELRRWISESCQVFTFTTYRLGC